MVGLTIGGVGLLGIGAYAWFRTTRRTQAPLPDVIPVKVERADQAPPCAPPYGQVYPVQPSAPPYGQVYPLPPQAVPVYPVYPPAPPPAPSAPPYNPYAQPGEVSFVVPPPLTSHVRFRLPPCMTGEDPGPSR